MYRYALLSLCLLLPLVSACGVSVSLNGDSDEAKRLLEISVPKDSEEVKIRGTVLMPDGTPPKECYVSMYATVYHYRKEFYGITAGRGGSSGGHRLTNGEPFEFNVPVDSNVLLIASTSESFNVGFGLQHIRRGAEKPEIYVAQPYTFSAEKENEEIVLQLEEATPVTGKLFYDNGDPAIRETISVTQFVPAARGADIPRVKNDSVAGASAITDENGDFEFQLWYGEFTLSAGGMPWVSPVTKTIHVEQGKPVETELAIPTPLRINVVMPDGSPAGNFRLCQLAIYRPVNQVGKYIPETWSSVLYDARRWDDDPPFVVPEHPIAMNLCREENYVTVMTEDNEYGIVRKLKPELMGQELTLTLRPTIDGTVQLSNAVNQDVSILVRIMKLERNGDYTLKSREFGPKLNFRTDAEGRVNFKVPVFEGIEDSVWLCFKRGSSSLGGSASHGEAHRLGSWFRHSKAEERFKQFRPPADGKPFDLGVTEVGR